MEAARLELFNLALKEKNYEFAQKLIRHGLEVDFDKIEDEEIDGKVIMDLVDSCVKTTT